MSLRPPAGVARGSIAHNPGYALALRVTGLAAQSSSVRLAGQAPRLPLAKHNGHYVSSGGRAPLLALSDAVRLGARSKPRSVLRTLLCATPATAPWRR